MRTGPILAVTLVTAIIAVILALLYVSAGPERLHLGTALATIFGVGLTVLMAGGLTALMFHSDRSGRDDAVGRNSRP